MHAPNLDTKTLPPPPGIIGSLRAGFDVTAGHITAILFPAALDLLLWLGPRLSVDQLVQPFLKQVGSMAASGGLRPEDISAALDMYQQFFREFNLLAVLRTFPIGIFSLMSGRLPAQSPLGLPSIVEIASSGRLIGMVLLLTLIGWMLGAIYFRWVAAIAAPENPLGTGRAVFQTLVYSVIWLIVAWMLGLPTFFMIYLLFMINTLVGEIVLLILGFISVWLVVPIFFSPHGMFVRKQNAFASILSSFQLTRFTLPTSSLFVLTVLLVGLGLNYLWAIPTVSSWLALIGILGHAFITTALLASSFVYYHDMSAWLQTVLARLRGEVPTQPA
jgi:hypothetical protein